MSMFDVARYLSYSNSIDHSKSKIPIFGINGQLSKMAIKDVIGKEIQYQLDGKSSLYAEPGKGL